MKKSSIRSDRPRNSKELPASQGMLQLVRSELKADIRGLRSEMKAGFRLIDSKFSQMDSKFSQMDSKFSRMDSKLSQMDSKFSQMDSKFSQMDSKLSQMNSKFGQTDSKFERVLSEIHRIGTLVEEQNSRNQIVLEGLTGLFQRQDRLELEMEEVRNGVSGLSTRSRR